MQLYPSSTLPIIKQLWPSLGNPAYHQANLPIIK
jgi:hypothetical protein